MKQKLKDSGKVNSGNTGTSSSYTLSFQQVPDCETKLKPELVVPFSGWFQMLQITTPIFFLVVHPMASEQRTMDVLHRFHVLRSGGPGQADFIASPSVELAGVTIPVWPLNCILLQKCEFCDLSRYKRDVYILSHFHGLMIISCKFKTSSILISFYYHII